MPGRLVDALGPSTSDARRQSGCSNGPRLAIAARTPQRRGDHVIRRTGVGDRILCHGVETLWSREEGMAGWDVEPNRKGVLHLGDNGLRLQAAARPDGADDMVAAALNPRSDRR
jgi:hypothetical protein